MRKVVGGRIPAKEHAKLIVEDAVDNVLERLIFARLEKPRELLRPDCMFTPEQMGPMWCWPGVESDALFFTPDQINSPEIVWPLRIGVVLEQPDRSLQCNWSESVPAERLRGKYRLAGRYNVGFHVAHIDAGKLISGVEFATWFQKRWMPSGRLGFDDRMVRTLGDSGGAPVRPYKVREFIEDGEADIGMSVAFAQSVALTYRYVWGAQFSIDSSARIIIPTTPDGLLELFNDRNKPADRDRRAPLRHWVRQHIRRRNSRPDFTKVREHLRGETKFNWRGYDVIIRPAAFDEERNESAEMLSRGDGVTNVTRIRRPKG